MTAVKRTAALFTCACLILVLFTSFACITCHACHNCVGEHCDVCKQIEEVKAMLQSFSLMIFAVLLVNAVLFIHRFLHAMEGFLMHMPCCTPVSLKVQLNN